MSILLLAVLSILVLVAGQTSLKYGLIRTGGLSSESFGLAGAWIQVLTDPYILIGFALYGVASLLWLRVLSELELSLAYPLVSLSYVFSLIIGWWLFQDHVSLTRIVGVILICLGAFFVSRS